MMETLQQSCCRRAYRGIDPGQTGAAEAVPGCSFQSEERYRSSGGFALGSLGEEGCDMNRCQAVAGFRL